MYLKLWRLMSQNSGKLQFFKIEMTFILKSMGLHGNKIFNIESNFISFKWEKKFFISIE